MPGRGIIAGGPLKCGGGSSGGVDICHPLAVGGGMSDGVGSNPPPGKGGM